MSMNSSSDHSLKSGDVLRLIDLTPPRSSE